MSFKILFAGALITAALSANTIVNSEKKYRMLCLGDSYTIGESVPREGGFPVQTAKLLKKEDIDIEAPVIIAKTGWTTGELLSAIETWEKDKANNFVPDKQEVLVTLLIGVNNEFRAGDLEEYRKGFDILLKKALYYTGGNARHVFVLSIPDWGATPFAAQDPKQRTPAQIGAEIDAFNRVNRQEALKANVHYLDITGISREAPIRHELLANDGLHPSEKMYNAWAGLLSGQIKEVIR